MLRSAGVTCIVVLALAAVASAQERGRGLPGGGFGGLDASPLALLRMAEVRKELGTTEEQNQKIDALGAEVRQQMTALFGGAQGAQDLSPEERRQRFADAQQKIAQVNRDADAKLAGILDARQQQRLNELRLQREGAAALNRPEVAQELGLTQEQKDKIAQVERDSRPQRGAGGFGDFQNLSEEERRKMIEEFRARREQAQQAMLGVLTAEQKSKLDKMKGKEFAFPQRGAGAGFAPRGDGAGPGPGRPPEGPRRRPAPSQD